MSVSVASKAFKILVLCAAPLIALSVQAKTRVWIDTDPSIGILFHDVDDGYALLYALNSRDLEIVGISSVVGNASASYGFRRAREIVSKFGVHSGLEASDVYVGASSPLARVQDLPPAVGALAEALDKSALTIVALGPLSNVALLIENYPHLVPRIKKIVFVGGRRPGQRFFAGRKISHEFHDSNVERDPQAVERILRSEVPLVLAPFELSAQTYFNAKDLMRIKQNGRGGAWLVNRSGLWLRAWQLLIGVPGGIIFDIFAVGVVTQPDDFECARGKAQLVAASVRDHTPQLVFSAQESGQVRYCFRQRETFKSSVLDGIF
ncbi:MAG: nucleoside hydrolase [Bdellovibrionota bacterium]